MILVCSLWFMVSAVWDLCGDIRLILRLRIDDLSDFTKYSCHRVRTERRKPWRAGPARRVLASHYCSVTLIVTVKLLGPNKLVRP